MRRRRALLPVVLLGLSVVLATACGGDDDGGVVAGEDAASDSGGGNAGSAPGNGGGTVAPAPPVVETTVPGGAPDTPVSDVPDDSAPTDPSVPVGDARIVSPTPGMDGVFPASLDSAVRRDGDKLEARFYGGVAPCYGVDHVDVVETATDVTITVFAGTPPEAAGRACIEIAELQGVIVALDAPLGDRVVIDGSSGSIVPLS